jgi:ribosome recycling factor
MPSIEEFLEDAKRRMDKSIEMTRTEFNSVRTGRASAALLDRISIDYYGTPTPLKNMASIGAPEPRMLTVQPFDPTQIKAIEKAVMESDLGLTPSNDGKIVRLPIPQLTEERRKGSSSSSGATRQEVAIETSAARPSTSGTWSRNTCR